MWQRETKKRATKTTQGANKVYTLEVFILMGPISKSFAKKNKVVSRTIKILGGQSLEDLHYAIFDAFDREEEHLYEFQIGGKGPMDPKARRYVHSALMDDLGEKGGPSGDVKYTTIESLGLRVDDFFGYWFDFGDDWWHQINVLAIEEAAARGKFPKVVKRVGKSPPQYVDWDEEDEEEEEE